MSVHVGKVAAVERIPEAALERAPDPEVAAVEALYVNVYASGGRVELCAIPLTLLPGGARALADLLVTAASEAERLADPTGGRGRLVPVRRLGEGKQMTTDYLTCDICYSAAECVKIEREGAIRYVCRTCSGVAALLWSQEVSR
jgi:hypothetical protein